MPLYGIRALCGICVVLGVGVLITSPTSWNWQVAEGLTLIAASIIGLFSSHD